jgi:hypothetical protein
VSGNQKKISNSKSPTSSTSPSTSPLSPSGYVIGTWLDNWGGLSRTVVIKKINSSYKITSTYSDGSGETKTLGVKIVNGEVRLYENLGNLYGDYMVIKSNGYLAFYDNQGFIYEVPPK